MRESADPVCGMGEIQRSKRSGFRTEHNVFGDRHRFHQHEMLVDHPDAKSDRLMWRCECVRFAVNDDFAFISGIETVCNTHRSGFAGAIFSDNRMDRSGADGDIETVIGEYVTESLADVAELEHLRSTSPSRWLL